MERIKKPVILVILAVASAVLHNLFYALFKIEEPVFFLLTFVFVFAVVVTGVRQIFLFVRNKKK